jgi:hypothetical protein
MLRGLADAYRVFDNPLFLTLAIQNASFLKSKMKKGEKLYHSYKKGNAIIEGYLEDYAFTIDGFISLYEATFDEQWINEAIDLTNYVIEHFYDPREGLFFFTADNSEKLIARKKEIFDNVIPASNSAMARNMYRLSLFLYKDDWKELAESMLSRIKRILLTEPSYLTNWACLYAETAAGIAEIAIAGIESNTIRKQIDQRYLPNKIMAGAFKESGLPILKERIAKGEKTQIFVCFDKVCQRPVDSADEAIQILTSTLNR